MPRSSDQAVARACERVQGLCAAGRIRDAIDELTAANRVRHDDRIERLLLHLRHAAFAELPAPPAATGRKTPAVAACPSGNPPTLQPDELSARALADAIEQHGCVRLQQVVPRVRAEVLADNVDRVFAAYDDHAAGRPPAEVRPWYEPFMPTKGPDVHYARPWVRQHGGVFAADSPRTFFDLVDAYEQCGLLQVVSEYLGERPVMSLDKSTLRRVEPGQGVTWHQDGSFLGEESRALNVWLALSSSRSGRPGLEFVPRRLDGVVETGTPGALHSWTVAPDLVEASCQGLPICRPDFEPGDALVFDGLLLHRTAPALEDGPRAPRRAVETWFFTATGFPEHQQVPIAC